MIKKRGFVLMETIIVISVLCVILVTLYGAYSKTLISVTKKSLYDNTEYIYKANLVRNLLEKSIPESLYNSSTYYVYCRNSLSDDARCYNHSTINNFENDLFSMLGVEAVYITLWDVTAISAESITTFEATTQNYIKTMDPTSENAFRIIVMFRSENNDTNKEVYEYATLRFGSRG